MIVAVVSCIYGLGSPDAYYGMLLILEPGQQIIAAKILAQAGRDSVRAQRHRFRTRNVSCARRSIEVHPTYEEHRLPHRDLGRRDRSISHDRSATGEVDQKTRPACRSIRKRTSSCHADDWKQAVETIKDELELAGNRMLEHRASCSRPSGSTSARCSTWR